MADLPLREILIGLFALLLLGLTLPLSHAARSGLILALVILSVLTLLGTASHWYLGLFQ
jgi:hypothetical protein